ncbi:hypothetical protein GT347_19200 [Xylophilus rhododendri]|uniref:Uncharacterized protein n=1 Tax=Xylophilus rhododendri TaxID=2697032 RepID=A0A857J7B5_9BURK|nr:hypothetical protein [Xylophilus rhododendri]QHI99920.1 hypothetical protein GT347_19200 [Xylophilus rhododendri]
MPAQSIAIAAIAILTTTLSWAAMAQPASTPIVPGTEGAPGARPANTTSAPLDSEGAGKPAKVRPTRRPTDPATAMETTAPVSRSGDVPRPAPALAPECPRP